MQLKGKQIKDGSIEQQKFNISTLSITDKNSVTNNDFVKTDTVDKVNMVDYSTLNLGMQANNASVGDKACETHVIEFPIGITQVKVNGVPVTVGENKDSYFSPDGVTIRDGGNAEKGDYLYWNSDGYDLDTDDEIDFIYLKSTDYYELDAGEIITFDENYNNLVVKYNGDSGTTMTVILDGVSFIVGNINGQFIWDIGGANEHTFTSPNESYVQEVNGSDYYIWFDGFGSLYYSIKKQVELIVEGFGFITTKQGTFEPYVTTTDGSVATWEISGENNQTTNTPSYVLDGTPKVVKMTIADYSKIETFNINDCGVNGTMDMSDLTLVEDVTCENNPLLDDIVIPPSTELQVLSLNSTSVKYIDLNQVVSRFLTNSGNIYFGFRNNDMTQQEVDTILNQIYTLVPSMEWIYNTFDFRNNTRPSNLDSNTLHDYFDSKRITFLLDGINEYLEFTTTATSYSYGNYYWSVSSYTPDIYPTWEVIETGDSYTGPNPYFSGLPTGNKTIRISNHMLIKNPSVIPLINAVGECDYNGIISRYIYNVSTSNDLITNIKNLYGHVNTFSITNTDNILFLDLSTIVIRNDFYFYDSNLENFSGLTSYNENYPIYIRGTDSNFIGVLDLNNAHVDNINMSNTTGLTDIVNMNKNSNYSLSLTANNTNMSSVLDLTGVLVRYINVNDTQITNLLIDNIVLDTNFTFSAYSTSMSGENIGLLLNSIYNLSSGGIYGGTISLHYNNDFIPETYENTIDLLLGLGYVVYYNSSVEMTFQTSKNGTFTPSVANTSQYRFIWSVSGESDTEGSSASYALDGTTRTVTLKNAYNASTLNLSNDDILDNPDLSIFGYRGTTAYRIIELTNCSQVTNLKVPNDMRFLNLTNCNIGDDFSLSGTTISGMYLISNPNITQFKEFIVPSTGVWRINYSNTSVSGVVDLQNYPFNDSSCPYTGYLSFGNTNITALNNANGSQKVRYFAANDTLITGILDLSGLGANEDINMQNTQISGILVNNGSSAANLTFTDCNMNDSEMEVLLNMVNDKFLYNISKLSIQGNEITSKETIMKLGKLYDGGWDITTDGHNGVILKTTQNGLFEPSVVTKDASTVEWLVEGLSGQTTNNPSYTLDGTERIVVIEDASQINEIYLTGITFHSRVEEINNFKNIIFDNGIADFSNSTTSDSVSYMSDFRGVLSELNFSNTTSLIGDQNSGSILYVNGNALFDNYQRASTNLVIYSSITEPMNLYARNSLLTSYTTVNSTNSYINEIIDFSGTTTLTNISIYLRTEEGNFITFIAPNNVGINRDLNYTQMDVKHVELQGCSINNLRFRNYDDGCYINVKDNTMTEANVDYLLNDINNTSAINGTLIIDGTNAAPSATGLTYKSSLEGKGWTVTVTV